MSEELTFPFMKLEQVEKVWKQVPNLREAWAQCPIEPDCPENQEWINAASKLFASSWTEHNQEACFKQLKAGTAEVARAQIEYLTTWLQCWDLKHEQKIAGAAWLMQLMFKSCPDVK